MRLHLFTPEVTFFHILAISTKKGPRPPIPAWPGLGSANSERLFVVQITAGRTGVPEDKKIRPAQNDCSCSIGIASARNQFRSSRDSHSAQGRPLWVLWRLWRLWSRMAPKWFTLCKMTIPARSELIPRGANWQQLAPREINSERAGIVILHRVNHFGAIRLQSLQSLQRPQSGSPCAE